MERRAVERLGREFEAINAERSFKEGRRRRRGLVVSPSWRGQKGLTNGGSIRSARSVWWVGLVLALNSNCPEHNRAEGGEPRCPRAASGPRYGATVERGGKGEQALTIGEQGFAVVAAWAGLYEGKGHGGGLT